MYTCSHKVIIFYLAAVARQMQEQQLKARQLVLQQQAASAVAAASKTQREVWVMPSHLSSFSVWRVVGLKQASLGCGTSGSTCARYIRL